MPSATASGSDAKGGNARSREHNQGNQDRTYTPEQKAAVLRIRKCGPTDFYEILAIEKTATDSEIKKAYRKLSLLTHPDKNSYDGADEAFKSKQINSLVPLLLSGPANNSCLYKWCRERFKSSQTPTRSLVMTGSEETPTADSTPDQVRRAEALRSVDSMEEEEVSLALPEVGQPSMRKYHQKRCSIASSTVALGAAALVHLVSTCAEE